MVFAPAVRLSLTIIAVAGLCGCAGTPSGKQSAQASLKHCEHATGSLLCQDADGGEEIGTVKDPIITESYVNPSLSAGGVK